MSSSGPPPVSVAKNRFIYPYQLANIAAYVSRLGMVEDVEVLRRTPVESPTDPANAYGDDALVFEPTADTTRHWVKGWVYSTPTQMQSVDTGAIITVNTYSFRCPVGTDIAPGDEVVINGDTYTVSDTTHENTWKVLINCTLRHRE